MRTMHRLAAQSKQRQFIQAKKPTMSPIEIVKRQVSTLTAYQREQMMIPYETAMNLLQFGGFGEEQWRRLADAFNVAEVLAQPPFNLANDHTEKFEAAQNVLVALADQFRQRKSWTARAAQLQTIKDALEMHAIQLQFVSQAELFEAAWRVSERCRQALAGNAVCQVVYPSA